MLTLAFWSDTFERALRTFAQGMLGTVTAGGIGILDVDWGQAASIGGLAAAVSVLTSVVASGVGEKGSASFVD